MFKILITWANSQLAQSIAKISPNFSENFEFYFFDKKNLDITDENKILEIFEKIKPDFCINTASYNAVDLAETDSENALLVNKTAVWNLAKICQKYNSIFIHFSTDYVFDGSQKIYNENDNPNPLNFYGFSKLEWEKLALQNCQKTIIIRTSWLYSEFNKNFVKTMLNLFATKTEISVVNDQFGQPTNANNLANAIMQIIAVEPKNFWIFHFSDFGEISWFDFAVKIAEFSNSSIKINTISTWDFQKINSNYLACRPQNSTLNLDKIQKIYNVKIMNWDESLKKFLQDFLKTTSNFR